MGGSGSGSWLSKDSAEGAGAWAADLYADFDAAFSELREAAADTLLHALVHELKDMASSTRNVPRGCRPDFDDLIRTALAATSTPRCRASWRSATSTY